MDVSIFQNKGNRANMEDETCYIDNFNGKEKCIFAGLYDGHAGSVIAKLAKEEMHLSFLKRLRETGDIQTSFEDAYHEISNKKNYRTIGSTALSFLIYQNILHVANAGDSRLILIRNGIAIQITNDHSVNNPEEVKRILEAGGHISHGYLWKGQISLRCTRALGDHFFNSVGLISKPEVFSKKLREGDLIIAATDGIWNVINNSTILSVTNASLSSEEAGRKIMSYVAGLSVTLDNISLIVIKY